MKFITLCVLSILIFGSGELSASIMNTKHNLSVSNTAMEGNAIAMDGVEGDGIIPSTASRVVAEDAIELMPVDMMSIHSHKQRV